MLSEVLSCLRRFYRRPFYPILEVVVLAIGLAGATAVFTYLNGFDQPFPGVDTDRLVRIFGVENEEAYQNIPYLDFLDYAASDGAFEAMAATQPYYAASVRRERLTEVAFLEAVSGEYFRVLGIDVGIGRGLTPDDDRPGAEAVAVLSHAWWQRSFGADRSVCSSTDTAYSSTAGFIWISRIRLRPKRFSRFRSETVSKPSSSAFKAYEPGRGLQNETCLPNRSPEPPLGRDQIVSR